MPEVHDLKPRVQKYKLCRFSFTKIFEIAGIGVIWFKYLNHQHLKKGWFGGRAKGPERGLICNNPFLLV